MNKKFWMKKVIGIIICVLAVGALLGYVVMMLWNNVLAVVVNVAIINFWQAVGLLILSKIFFGGFRGGWGRGGHKRHEMKEKWQGMTEEEREKIKQEWRNRCRVWGKKETDPKAGAE